MGRTGRTSSINHFYYPLPLKPPIRGVTGDFPPVTGGFRETQNSFSRIIFIYLGSKCTLACVENSGVYDISIDYR